jgi:hypothetical protein
MNHEGIIDGRKYTNVGQPPVHENQSLASTIKENRYMNMMIAPFPYNIQKKR